MKKTLSVLLVAVLLLSVLGGCGNASGNGGAATTSKSSEETTLQSSQETEKVKEPVTISFSTTKAVSKDFLTKFFDDFNKESGITVQADYVTSDKYDTILPTKIAAGEMPDVAQVFPDKRMIGLYGLQPKGYLLDISNEPFVKDYMDSVNGQLSIDGKIYAISTAQLVLPVVYNKKLFKQAGIDKTPNSINEFWEICEKLKAAKIVPMATNAKDYGWFFEVFAIAPSVIFAKDMDWEKKREKGEVKFNSEPWKQTLTILDTMLKKGYFMDKPLSLGYADSVDAFATGKAAMLMMGNWEFENIVKKGGDGFEFGAFFFPGNQPGEPLVYPGSIGELYAISSSTKHPEECKALLAYMTKRGAELTKEFGGLTTLKNAASDNTLPAVQELMPVIQNNKSYTFLNNEWPNGFQDFCLKGAQSIIAGSLTIDKDLEDADVQFDAALKKAQEQSK